MDVVIQMKFSISCLLAWYMFYIFSRMLQLVSYQLIIVLFQLQEYNTRVVGFLFHQYLFLPRFYKIILCSECWLVILTDQAFVNPGQKIFLVIQRYIVEHYFYQSSVCKFDLTNRYMHDKCARFISQKSKVSVFQSCPTLAMQTQQLRRCYVYQHKLMMND